MPKMQRSRLATGILVMLLALPATASDEDYLRVFKLEMWPTAYRTQDVELLDNMLHDTFVVITDSGTVSTKQEELDFIANTAWDPGAFEYRIDRLDIYDGSVAIISGRGFAETYSYTSSNTLIKQGGRWRAVASHVSGIERKGPQDVGGFHAVSVRDLDKSIAWYREHLGFELESSDANDERKGALLSRQDTLLELAEFDGATALDELDRGRESYEVYGVFKLGFRTTDLDAVFGDLEAAEVDILFPIVTASSGNRTFGIKDIDGNIIQFFGE